MPVMKVIVSQYYISLERSLQRPNVKGKTEIKILQSKTGYVHLVTIVVIGANSQVQVITELTVLFGPGLE
jgi:hypothetical protein